MALVALGRRVGGLVSEGVNYQTRWRRVTVRCTARLPPGLRTCASACPGHTDDCSVESAVAKAKLAARLAIATCGSRGRAKVASLLLAESVRLSPTGVSYMPAPIPKLTRMPPPFRSGNPFVRYAGDFEEAAIRLRKAARTEQAVDCLRSIRHFLEIAEKEIGGRPDSEQGS